MVDQPELDQLEAASRTLVGVCTKPPDVYDPEVTLGASSPCGNSSSLARFDAAWARMAATWPTRSDDWGWGDHGTGPPPGWGRLIPSSRLLIFRPWRTHGRPSHGDLQAICPP